MVDVLIAIGHHRPAAVPPATPHDDHLASEERISRAHDGADIHVVLPVLDRHDKVVPPRVEVGHDSCDRPISVLINDVATVTELEQLRIEPHVRRPGQRVGSDADIRQIRRGVVSHGYSRPRSASV
jgi:hypothetical protein